MENSAQFFEHTMACYIINLLSLVGRVFFSAVSVFLSLLLSKEETSEMSGLSAMVMLW